MADTPQQGDPKVNPIDTPTRATYSMQATISYMRDFVSDILHLEKGVNKRATIEEIRDKKSMAGANAWMLMCSIVIASIGLSQNSQAVIIGAMLISPLMSPILGIGLSVGINDMDTLRKSLAHFAVAMAIAILTSTIYFLIFDFGEMTPEIEARTRPTLLDIFVAVFGGLAGIISIARKDISTTLPGVAIATALMPPLCVTGYGLATGQWEIAARSFYLFFLNTFFVALSTYLIIRFLKFPYKKYVKVSDKRRNQRYILLFSLLLMLPAFMIFRGVIKDLRVESALKKFQSVCLGSDDMFLDSYQLYDDSDTSQVLYLKCYGDVINMGKKEVYEDCLTNLGLPGVKVQIINSSDVNLDQLKGLEKNIQDIGTQLSAVNAEKQKVETLMKSYAITHIDSANFVQIRDELKALYPDITEIGMAKAHVSDFDKYKEAMPTVMIKWENEKDKERAEKEATIRSFLEQRMRVDTLLLLEM